MHRVAEHLTVAGLPVRIWQRDGAGTTVLGLPGLGGSGQAWAPLADASPWARIVAPDLRGRGLAYQATGPTGLRAHARDLKAIAEELGLRDLVVVGHSMGAYLAPVAAEELADRVCRLVLVDGGVRPKLPFFLTPSVARFMFRRQFKRLDRPFADVDELCAVVSNGALDARPDLVDKMKWMLIDDLTEADNSRPRLDFRRLAEDAVDSFFGPDLEPALDALRVPATLIAATHGNNDKAKPFLSDVVLDHWAQRQPNLRVRRVEGNHTTVLFSDAVTDAMR